MTPSSYVSQLVVVVVVELMIVIVIELMIVIVYGGGSGWLGRLESAGDACGSIDSP